MASQADLFGPSVPTDKFYLTKGEVTQGVVTREPVVSDELDYKTKQPKLNSYGSAKQQLAVIHRDNDGVEKRIFFRGGMLFALKKALQEASVASVKAGGPTISEVQVGGTIGVVWSGDEKTDSGFDAKVFTVKYAPPTD